MIQGLLAETGRPAEIRINSSDIRSINPLDPAPSLWLAPGFIDIQVNGYAGYDLNSPDVTADTVAHCVRSLWLAGVTAVCPTVTTQSESSICRSLRAIREACETDPLIARSIVCIHVEGPHISPEDGARGAHPLEHVRPPTLDEYRRWQDAAGGRIGIITLAPEHPGSLEYIRAVVAEGVVVALGHTAASEDQILAAVNAGASLSTCSRKLDNNCVSRSQPRHSPIKVIAINSESLHRGSDPDRRNNGSNSFQMSSTTTYIHTQKSSNSVIIWLVLRLCLAVTSKHPSNTAQDRSSIIIN